MQMPSIASNHHTGRIDWRSRLRAAGIHLLLSLLVAGLVALLVFLLWYPFPYREVSSGRELFLLVIAVDVVIGPLLTLAVFDRRKPTPVLRRDLAVLVVLQLAALGYGLHTMFIARPAVLALEGDRLRVVAVHDVLASELGQAPPPFDRLPITGPMRVRTANPTPEQKFDAIRLALSGHDLGARPTFWRPWDETAHAELRQAAKPLDPLYRRYAARADELRAAIARTGVPAERIGYVPVISRHDVAVALVDRRAGEIVGFAPFEGF
jgi:hypothetical protein